MECRNETAVVYNAKDETMAIDETMPIFEARICLKGDRSVGRRISNINEVKQYISELMSSYATETLLVVSVNMQCQVISTAIVNVGSLGSVDVDIANIAKVALLSNARAIFLSHNHPGGTCRPSSEDISATMQIKRALALFQIDVYDHIIVCPNGESYSMKQNGDF